MMKRFMLLSAVILMSMALSGCIITRGVAKVYDYIWPPPPPPPKIEVKELPPPPPPPIVVPSEPEKPASKKKIAPKKLPFMPEARTLTPGEMKILSDQSKK